MKSLVLGFVVVAVMLTCPFNAYGGTDPGIPDTIRIDGGPLVVGQSKAVTLTIVNDEDVGGYSLGLISRTVDGGSARFDSAQYVGRMADPSVLNYRIASSWSAEGQLPDTALVSAVDFTAWNPLPPGNDAIIKLFFTGVSSGTMRLDSGYVPPAGRFILSARVGGSIHPQFRSAPIQVIVAPFPPQLTIPTEPPRVVAGNAVTFEVSAQSSGSLPVTLTIERLTGADDPSRIPSNQPTLGSASPGEFNWLTTGADVGIWEAVIRAWDPESGSVTGNVEIQVVQQTQFLIAFQTSEKPGSCHAAGLLHGNFDADPNAELFLTGSGSMLTPTVELYDYTGGGSWEKAFEYKKQAYPKPGPQLGYLNGDDFLDAVFMNMAGGSNVHTMVMLGDGSNSFTLTGGSNDGYHTRSSGLGELTGDNYLDLATIYYDGVRIFAGDGQAGFHAAGFIAESDSAVTVSCADFNGDGADDLAVGTKVGVKIYLKNASGGYVLANSYSQTYGSVDIEVTNQGSDFNNDNVFDLCISTPSVGGAYSDLMVYLGQGSGSFTQSKTRTVKGQIFGNCVGDFNNDHNLDIAFVNGARQYAAILFGDGNGVFTNEIRYHIPHHNPCYIDGFDIDLDGDLDLAIAANDPSSGNSLFFLYNQLNPSGFSPCFFEIVALDNAELELVSPSGMVLNRMRNSMPSAAYYKRNVDLNTTLDAYATLSVVEVGEYLLTVMPKPGAESQNFTVEFSLNHELYRLAKDAPMSPGGYTFGIYAASQSGVTPRPGKIIGEHLPLFTWQGSGQFDFQLASDIGFTQLIVDRTVMGSSYAVSSPLSSADTTTYYWRVKPRGTPVYKCIYVVNISDYATDAADDVTGTGLPESYNLGQNYPNPFNQATAIQYSVPTRSHVTIVIYNVLGEKVRRLVDEEKAAGSYSVFWDGTDGTGKDVPSGVYLYRARSGRFEQSRKMMLLK